MGQNVGEHGNVSSKALLRSKPAPGRECRIEVAGAARRPTSETVRGGLNSRLAATDEQLASRAECGLASRHDHNRLYRFGGESGDQSRHFKARRRAPSATLRLHSGLDS